MAETNLTPGAGSSGRALRIVMVGTRALPAPHDSHATTVEEVGRRLVDRGHAVTVYCRSPGGDGRVERVADYLGMRVIHLPALPVRALTAAGQVTLRLSHTTTVPSPDAAFIFNAAHAPFIPLLRLHGIPTTVHVDAIEETRSQWGSAHRSYRRWAEQVSVRGADCLIAGEQSTVDYYREEYRIPTELISHGARVLHDPPTTRLAELGLAPHGYHLAVAQFATDSQLDVVIDGYRRSGASLPLAVVGILPQSGAERRRILTLADDPRVRLLGGLTDQDQLDQLYAHSVSYLHGCPIGGMDAALLRAMGARTAAIAWEARPNRDALGVYGAYFRDTENLARLIEDAELHPHHTEEVSEGLQRRAAALYNWGAVTDSYEDLAQRLVFASARTRERTVVR